MRLRPLPPEKVIKVLEKVGFQKERQEGSHVILKHPDSRVTIVPVHKGEDIGKGLLRKIIKDARLSREEFLKFV